jgi:hypothetical protein
VGIWYIYGYLVYFSHFEMLYQDNSGSPVYITAMQQNLDSVLIVAVSNFDGLRDCDG